MPCSVCRSNYNPTKVDFAYFGFSPGGAPDKRKHIFFFPGGSGATEAEVARPSSRFEGDTAATADTNHFFL
jgi:hypothetical protein